MSGSIVDPYGCHLDEVPLIRVENNLLVTVVLLVSLGEEFHEEEEDEGKEVSVIVVVSTHIFG